MKQTPVHLLLILFVYVEVQCHKHVRRQNKMSRVLDKMLEGYDKRLRPGFGGPPITVHGHILVRSMGPISERDMVYSMDCYYRQLWEDKRLASNMNRENISLSIKFLERIWHPDTVFFNGRRSYLHTITTPNKFIRLNRNGTILFSQRLTVRASCKMHLENFPMDTQQCPLELGSFGYSADEVIYKWHPGLKEPVEIASHMTLNQFDLIGYPASNFTKLIKDTPHTILAVKFFLRRHTGFFLIQVYIPCILLVVLSWVSFWINREATSDRIALGTTTVLTMTFLGLDIRTDLPKVSYVTALDYYVAVCFGFVISTIIQFAVVHYFTKYGTGDMNMVFQTSDDSDDSGEIGEITGRGRSNGDLWVTDNAAYANSHRRPLRCFYKMWDCVTGTRNYSGRSHPRDTIVNTEVQDKVALRILADVGETCACTIS
ncbi:gamma-aminobutyric acid receptor alpha-like [Octopus vulgaris]|uniref:Gamma-aminobutyric acid receptor alpha-like n=1 Tax=Octopus vulgaris TaxID=6645 RepID=A0AA36B3H9_OCTVU|nr:gamma-aminobutyric acid receptor alpha-like [Octopus vulgaris]